MREEGEKPRWQEDFPIEWERDHYVTRRELAKFLTLGSALLAGASGLLAVVGRWWKAPTPPARLIGRMSDLSPAGFLMFRYPTEEDPCILVRTPDGTLEAYSQVCTHLSCALVYRGENRTLFCPCHKGEFTATEGRPIAGPPTRRLPRIVIRRRGEDLYATGREI